MPEIRLNKLLADLGFASRRGADALIEKGLIKVNKRKAKLGMKIDPKKDSLVVKRELVDFSKFKDELAHENYEYWVLNKPARIISAVSDPDGRKTVMRFFGDKTKARLYPVGRLDFESEGLLLMTNDGDLAYRLTHPKFGVEKEYRVWATGIFSQDKVSRLEYGVRLREGRSSADKVELLEKNGRELELKFIMHEGKKREVRRIASRVGWEVKRLQRVRIANLELGPLSEGNVRKLSDEEILELKAAVDLA